MRPDGQQRTVVAEGQPVTDEFGVCVKVAGTLRDVTERRRTEQQLLQAQKMETVGQLTGGLAHDFNNLLGALIGHLDLAEACAEADSPVATHCHVALDAALKGAELVKRLLAFSRRQMLFPKPTDLHEVIDSLLPLVERTLGEHIRITTQCAAGLWPALADTAQLESAILNLMVNARDAMPDGGTVIDRGKQYHHRHGVGDEFGRATARRLRCDLCRRYRPRHAAGSAGSRVRAFLHDQGTRRGQRPRAQHGVRHHAAAWRDSSHL